MVLAHVKVLERTEEHEMERSLRMDSVIPIVWPI